MSHANPDNYPMLEADKLRPTGDRILLAWDEKMSTLLDGKLINPVTNRKQHYTGTVIAFGELVDPSIKKGDRLAFDQFSNFEKFYDPKYGRLALIEESRQGDCFAIIPLRVKVGEGESDFDYSK
jgi:co-chaperonin GroES (HSP10)